MLFQFEEFSNENGLRLLNRYRGDTLTFNDDIQGTAAASAYLSALAATRMLCPCSLTHRSRLRLSIAVLAGILAALPMLRPGGLAGQTFLFAGAGETGAGWADLLASAIAKTTREPLTQARKRIWLFDAQGLVTRARAARNELEDHKLPWAHEAGVECGTLEGAVRFVRPSCLIGVRRHGFSYGEASALAGPQGTAAGLFTAEVLTGA